MYSACNLVIPKHIFRIISKPTNFSDKQKSEHTMERMTLFDLGAGHVQGVTAKCTVLYYIAI